MAGEDPDAEPLETPLDLVSNSQTESNRRRRDPPRLPIGKQKGRLLSREEIDSLMFGYALAETGGNY